MFICLNYSLINTKLLTQFIYRPEVQRSKMGKEAKVRSHIVSMSILPLCISPNVLSAKAMYENVNQSIQETQPNCVDVIGALHNWSWRIGCISPRRWM